MSTTSSCRTLRLGMWAHCLSSTSEAISIMRRSYQLAQLLKSVLRQCMSSSSKRKSWTILARLDYRMWKEPSLKFSSFPSMRTSASRSRTLNLWSLPYVLAILSEEPRGRSSFRSRPSCMVSSSTISNCRSHRRSSLTTSKMSTSSSRMRTRLP